MNLSAGLSNRGKQKKETKFSWRTVRLVTAVTTDNCHTSAAGPSCEFFPEHLTFTSEDWGLHCPSWFIVCVYVTLVFHHVWPEFLSSLLPFPILLHPFWDPISPLHFPSNPSRDSTSTSLQVRAGQLHCLRTLQPPWREVNPLLLVRLEVYLLIYLFFTSNYLFFLTVKTRKEFYSMRCEVRLYLPFYIHHLMQHSYYLWRRV